MTRSHRRIHFIAWLVLSPAIVGVLIAALVSRAGAKARLSSPASQTQETRP